MDKKQSTAKSALLASASFAGYNIGSGFATGLEGQQFFASWGGTNALIGLIVALLTTAVVFIPVYLVGYKKKADEKYNVYHYYCGDKIGTVIDWYMYFSILLIILTMMSGAGATINQYFGIPKMVGAIILGVLCILAALLGLQKLMHILSWAGVVIIVFVIICTVYILCKYGMPALAAQEAMDAYVAAGEVKRISILGLSNPVISGIASAGLLIVSSLPWVASTGSLCENKKTAITSGALSGVLFYAAQAVVVFLNLICMNSIAGEEVPVLAVFQNFLPVLAMVYSCIIILAIFSTVSGRLFIFADRFDRGNKKAHVIIIIAVVVAAAIAGTFISFSTISNFMFTINGCLGILLGLTIVIRTIIAKVRKKEV